jgi:hypothetical protein
MFRPVEITGLSGETTNVFVSGGGALFCNPFLNTNASFSTIDIYFCRLLTISLSMLLSLSFAFSF